MTVDAIGTKIIKYEELREKAEKAKEAMEEANKRRDAAEADVITAILDKQQELGVPSLRIGYDGRNYSVTLKEYYSIPKANRDGAYELMRNLGMGDLIQEKVDDRTLTKELEAVREGNEGQMPEEYGDLLELLKTYPKATLRRPKE